MTYFTEFHLEQHTGGLVERTDKGSVAAKAGLRAGDRLIAINGQLVEDVIDVQFYAAEEEIDFLVHRDGATRSFSASRAYGQQLGLTFAHPTFDTDIRRCNNLCEFCFVLQMAPRFRRTLYVKDDDYRYSFLFGHYVTLTNLDDHDWWRIETMRLSPLYVSVHVTDLDRRRQYLRNPNAPDIMGQLRWLAERDIAIHTQLVIVPGVNDGRWMEQSVVDLASLWPAVQSITVVPVGLTCFHKYGLRPNSAEESQQILEVVSEMQRGYLSTFKRRFVYASDEWYLKVKRPTPALDEYDGLELHENGLGLVSRFLRHWSEEQSEISGWKTARDRPEKGATPPRPERITLATGTLFRDVLRHVAVEFQRLTGIETQVHAIENHRFGQTITAAGLLTAEDITAQLKELPRPDLLVLPRVAFDHPEQVTLDGRSPQEIADELATPVALADVMGDVLDALEGRSRLLFPPRV